MNKALIVYILKRSRKSKKSKRSPSPAYIDTPVRSSKRRSRSPYSKKTARDSISPPKSAK